MDKLRALQYFLAAAEERSFSGAARRMGVSVPAITKLITSLERSLGASLFDRSTHGLALTVDGHSYFEACQAPLALLAAADDAVSATALRPSGTLVVGAHGFVAQHCITPALPALHARYPDLQIDVRPVDRVTDSSARVVDVFLLLGWPEPANLVQRRIAETRFVICAAPSYWAQHAPPAHPRDLIDHDCLLFRIPDGRLLDFWQCERQGERADIAVTGWLVSNHRDVLLDTALAGHGVGRFVDVTVLPHLRSGALVPVLTDWRQLDAPPVSLLYRPHHRRTPRVRVFIDFMNDLFRRLDAERDGPFKVSLPTQKPRWYKLRSSRVSAGVKTGR